LERVLFLRFCISHESRISRERCTVSITKVLPVIDSSYRRSFLFGQQWALHHRGGRTAASTKNTTPLNASPKGAKIGVEIFCSGCSASRRECNTFDNYHGMICKKYGLKAVGE
jgi:hypothetical protein